MANRKRHFVQLMVVVAFLAGGGFGMAALTSGKSELEKVKPANLAPLVQTLRVDTGARQITIGGEGTVRPLREISLVPQVGGKVVYVSPALVDGGEFKKGDLLLRINPVDYELALTLAEANVKDAESKLSVALQEAAAAKEEWRLLYEGKEKEKSPPPLVAKEPQRQASQALLDAARADLKRARLSLERTELRAPFDGRISEKKVDVGQYVSPGQPMGVFFSTEAAEISVPLDDEETFWLSVPGFTPGDGKGSLAVVHARIGGHDLTWTGEVVRTEGEIDPRTRMINVVIRVERPYERKPPLAAGLFARVDIQGVTLKDAVVLPREALRENQMVWVVDEEGRLRFRKVEVARVQGNQVTVKGGLTNGEMVVLSPMSVVTDGMAVRTSPSSNEEMYRS